MLQETKLDKRRFAIGRRKIFKREASLVQIKIEIGWWKLFSNKEIFERI
jgi:hypothetical protein